MNEFVIKIKQFKILDCIVQIKSRNKQLISFHNASPTNAGFLHCWAW